MKKVIVTLIVLIIVVQANLSIAASKKDLEDQQDQIDDKIDETEEKIKELEAQKSETLKEVENLITQISEYETEIDNLQEEIDVLQSQIDTAEKSIKEKEAQYVKEKGLLDERLLTMCENGDTKYLDVLLGSTSIIDFISKYNTITELVESDIQLLESIDQQKKEIEGEKAKLESDKKELDIAQASLEAKQAELKTAKSNKDKQVKKLSAEEKEAQKELEKFEKDKKEIAEELKRIAEEEEKNNSNNIAGKPSSSGYIFPVQGLGKSNINNKTYPSYAGHTGVDVNINVIGKKVVAVKDGTVEISRAIPGSIKNYDSNGNVIGSYSSYGEYVVINHHDGTMTLYGHMKPGSRTVSAGQKVKQGQVIGTVGNTGNCKPRPTASNPTQGTHLHFEVRIKGLPVNPIPYLP